MDLPPFLQEPKGWLILIGALILLMLLFKFGQKIVKVLVVIVCLAAAYWVFTQMADR